ncbi:MAG: hypothetical protein NVS9B12_15600 [Vulcanimicrobiaceae bacterium]
MTRDVQVRPFRATDVRALRDGFAAGSIARFTRFSFPRSLAAIYGEFDQTRKRKHLERFAIIINGRFGGVCTLREPLFAGRELTIGIFDPKDQGKGVGSYVIRRVCAFGFHKLNLHRIELGVYTDNLRAQRCYTRCGFKREAVLRKFLYNDGRYRDILWMSILREEFGSRH